MIGRMTTPNGVVEWELDDDDALHVDGEVVARVERDRVSGRWSAVGLPEGVSTKGRSYRTRADAGTAALFAYVLRPQG